MPSLGRQFPTRSNNSTYADLPHEAGSGYRPAPAPGPPSDAEQRRDKWMRSRQGRDTMREIKPEKGKTLKEHYAERGWGQAPEGVQHMGQGQLPGMDPMAAPNPTKLEDLHPAVRARFEQDARENYGITVGHAERAYGAAIDRAHMRAEQHGTTEPAGKDWYSETGAGVGRIRQRAERAGIPHPELTAATTAASPRVRWETKGGGNPNINLGEKIHRQVSAGVPSEEVKGSTKDLSWKAAEAVRSVQQGRPLSEPRQGPTRSGDTSTKHLFTSKTGPFHNAAVSGPQFTTLDYISGSQGAPHVGTEKRVTASGSKTKSEIEEALEKGAQQGQVTGGVGTKAVLDLGMRRAMAKRGLTHIPSTQALGWVEHQIHHGAYNEGKYYEHAQHPEAVPPPHPENGNHLSGQQFDPGPDQGEMFRQRYGKGSHVEKPKLSSTPDPGENKFEPGSEWKF